MQFPKKLGMAGGGVFCFSVLFGYYLFDKVLQFGVRDQTALRKRNEVRGIYLKIPFALEFKVYFFNISNPEQVMKGAKPNLQEVGPYYYDEWKEKIDVEDNNVEDSLTYTQYDTFYFNQEKSGDLRDDDYVTILNPLLVGMVNTVERDTPDFLNVLNKAIDSIFKDPKSIYVTVKVKDILFDGIKVYCASKDFAPKAVCAQVKQLPGFKSSDEKNVFLFSLLGTRNATHQKRFKILRGIKNSKDLGRLLELDGERKLNLWSTPNCNRFRGTDGWIFPPGLTKEEGIWTFTTTLCRSINAYYVEDLKFKGIAARRYYADLGDMSRNADEKCYCPKTCMKKGVFDMTKCIGVTIYGTLPHFLMADEIYLQQVNGLSPKFDEHIIKINFEPLTGAPLEARVRLQFNMPLHPVKRISLFKNISTSLHPIFWVEEGVEVEGDLLKKVTLIFLIIKIIGGFKYVGMAAGVAMGGAGVYLHLRTRKGADITKLVDNSDSPANNKNNAEEIKSNEINVATNAISQTNSGTKLSQKDNNLIVNHIMSGHELGIK